MQDITIYITDRNGEKHELIAPTDIGLSIMELCKMYELPVAGTCGGMAMCSTCHVYVLSNHTLHPRSIDEENTLYEMAFNVDDIKSRLGCQLKIDDSMHGLELQLADDGL